jgi:RND superfamily putative drug exporter
VTGSPPEQLGDTERVSVFYRLGLFCARRRVAVIVVWAIALVAALPLALQLPGALRSGGFSLPDLEAARAREVLATELGASPSAMVVVFESTTPDRAGDPAFEQAVARALAGLPAAPHVSGIVTHQLNPQQVSPDRRVAYEIVMLDLPPDDSPDALEPVEAALTEQPGLRTYLAGTPAFYGDIQQVSEDDLRRSELISLPLAALALVLVFGSLVAAATPIVVGGTAVVVALAVIFGIASTTPMSIFVLNLATLLGLGLGVDYALLLTSRFREEMAARGAGSQADQSVVNEAVAATVATAGRAVFFSGLTVLLGLIGLMLFEFMILRSVGIAGAAVVGFAVSGALTLLPAILALLGPRLDALAVRRRRRTDVSPPAEGGWARLAQRVMARPLAFFLPTLIVLLLLGAPFVHVRFNAPDASILPPGVPSRQAYDLLVREFGEGEFAPLFIAVRTPGSATDPANVGALYDWSRRIAADPRVRQVDSLVNLDPRLTRAQYQLLYGAPGGPADRFAATVLARTTRRDLTQLTVFTRYGPNRHEAQALVNELRSPGSALSPPPGMTVLIGGGAAEVLDVVRRIWADFPRTALFILATTYLVLLVLLRSVVLPAKALIVNALSITASFGALVWIFQDGNLSALLGFTPLGFVETTLPVILFCVLFGLSMDYEVFMLTRMHEVWDRTHDNREAVARGMERSGRIVTSAALIVVVVAGSFTFADIVLIKALGLGVAIAVALDATLVRALLVPSAMRLLGDRNWWLPARLRRLLPPLAALLVLAGVLAGCSGAPILANPTPPKAPIVTPSPTPARPADPQPVNLPRDDAPHDRLTEWWYYTGHLLAADGRRFGFEFVIFRAERGSFPVSWASHLALTDETAGTFSYEQRSEIGAQVDQKANIRSLMPDSELAAGFDLSIVGDPRATEWRMAGAGETALLSAGSSDLWLTLRLADTRSQPVLHGGDGWVDFGPAGGSYYYSRPRMDAAGLLSLGGESLEVTGTAWFDHQWGDFIAVGGGGWDWFAVNLDDGTDLTLSLVRAADDSYPLVYGTLVAADGTAEHLSADQFSVETADSWTSPHTGATYPAGWTIEIPAEQLLIHLRPSVADQELDTRATTGVVYWEGSQVVSATRAGRPVGGQAYVELTGYAPDR